MDQADMSLIPTLDQALRLGVAALLSGLIGFEREIRSHPAGLRTHMLIGLAAAVFTVAALELAHRMQGAGPGFGIDPLRAVEAVTAGVAFVAAGAIIRTEGRVRHLTTGAGLWAAGAIGLACGAGFIGLAILATGIALVILIAFAWLEDLFTARDD